jgi:hypothetical protein
MKLSITKKSYPHHIAIRLLADGKQIGWLQYEGNNIAFYGSMQCKTVDHGGSVYIKNLIHGV